MSSTPNVFLNGCDCHQTITLSHIPRALRFPLPPNETRKRPNATQENSLDVKTQNAKQLQSTDIIRWTTSTECKKSVPDETDEDTSGDRRKSRKVKVDSVTLIREDRERS